MNYLLTCDFLPTEFELSENNFDDYGILEIEEEKADALRDFFGERLQTHGFDMEYNLNFESQILEDLIDKFFCG